MSVRHCLPSVILLAICVCVFFLQISQVSLCYYLEQSIVCHLIGHLCVCVCVCVFLKYLKWVCVIIWRRTQSITLSAICYLIGQSGHYKGHQSLIWLAGAAQQSDHTCYFLTIFLDFSTKKIPKIFITKHFNKNTNTNTNTKTIWLAGGPVRPYLLFLSRFSESIKKENIANHWVWNLSYLFS